MTLHVNYFQAIGQGQVSEFYFLSTTRSGKSQGILHNGKGSFKCQESQVKVRDSPNFGHNCLAVAGIYPFWVIEKLVIFLSLAFSSKRRGDIVFGCAWLRVYTRYFVSTTPPTVFNQSFWNFTGVFIIVWRCACAFYRILKLCFFSLFSHF